MNMDMDEQKNIPESQEQHSLDEHDINYPAQPYYWSTKPDAPKDEPASLYDDPMLQGDNTNDYQHGYSAQQSATSIPQIPLAGTAQKSQPSATYGQQSQARSRYQQQFYSPDGDAFEQQYRSNNTNFQQWNVPVWARPQRQRRKGGSARWLWFIILGIMFIGPLMHVLGFLLVAGVIFLVLLFPLLIVGLFSIPFMLSRALTGRPFPQRRWRSWRNNNYNWRGPWGW